MTRRVVRSLLSAAGYEVRRKGSVPPDFSPAEADIWHTVRPYTMTSAERVVSLVRAVEYVLRYSIPGSFVECGVWKGGSMLAVAMQLLRLGVTDRDIFLFDTFEGMTEPGEHDHLRGSTASSADLMRDPTVGADYHCRAGLPEVYEAFNRVPYPKKHVHFVKGPVEQTLPGSAPERIALLRLDTDWYESTRHELVHLFPRVVPGGVLIVDDYGHWEGARRAVDEYFEQERVQMHLARVDYTGRIGTK